MNDLPTVFYKNPYILWLSIVVIIASGFSALMAMSKSEDPTINNRFATLTTYYPGASATKIETQISDPLEQVLMRIPEIKHISANAAPGISYILIELKDEITNGDLIFSKIRDYVADVSLPQGAGRPTLDDTKTYAYTSIYAISFPNANAKDYLLAGRYAKELASRLRTVRGTDKIAVFGDAEEEVYVHVDPVKLADMDLTLSRLAEKIKAFDARLSAGSINHQGQNVIVEVSGGFEQLKRLRELPLQSKDGSVVYLQDIAKIDLAPLMPKKRQSRVNGFDVVLIGARMLSGDNINLWHERIEDKILQFSKELPAHLKLIHVFDQQYYTNKRFATLNVNVLQSLGSIILVLVITMGIRGALIVSTALPLTVLLTLYLLYILGFGLHQITVIGLIVALGIMIDNAIVIAEAIQSERQQGVLAIDAVRNTIKHFWLPLLGATLTTILAFFPIILLKGPTGEFVGGVGYAVILTLISSYLISHTIIAALAGKYMHDYQSSHWFISGIKTRQLHLLFASMLNSMLRHPRTSATYLLIFALLGLGSRFFLVEQFFPASDRNQINIEVFADAGTNLDKNILTIKKIEQYLKQEPEITQQVWHLGESMPVYYYNLMMTRELQPNYSQGMITVREGTAIRPFIKQLQEKLNQLVPEVTINVKKIDQGPPVEALELRIYGYNLERLKQLGEQLRLRMGEINGVIHTDSSLKSGMPKMIISLNEDQVSNLNLTSKSLADELKAYIDGINAGILQDGSEQIPVRVRLDELHREHMADLLQLPINLIAGSKTMDATPLAAIAHIEAKPDWLIIPRRDNQRLNTISAHIEPNRLPADVLKELKLSLSNNPLPLPPGYSLEIGGEAEKRNESIDNLMSSLPLILVLLLSVLILTFQNMMMVSIMLIIIVTSLSMGLLSLWISGYPFGFQVIIALVGLIGLAINAAIIILSEIDSCPKARRGNLAAISVSVQNCMRHIVSTTMTTIAGFLPLILANDLFWPPFGWTLAGGTLLTTSISVFLVPVLYRLFTRFSHKHP